MRMHAIVAFPMTSSEPAGQPASQPASQPATSQPASQPASRWLAGDTSDIGSYQAEFEVTYADGNVETFPNSRYINVEIIDNIS